MKTSGVHLQDLVFIEDGNPNTLGSLINWRKCKYVANIVSLIQLYQSMSYSLEIPNHGGKESIGIECNYY